MDSDLRKNPNSRSFSFDSLPDEIQSRILALLPITTLVLCKAVSRSWRSLIRSPAFTDSYRPSRDPIFILYSYACPTLAACAYLPFTDTWFHFRFPQPVSILPTTGASLLLVQSRRDKLYIVNPFSPPHPIHFLPPVLYAHRWHNVTALIEHSPLDYIIVVDSLISGIRHTQTYDSRSRRWEERGHLQIQHLGNAVYLDGLLFCLSHGPNCLLTLDPVGGQWSMLDLDLPVPLFQSHLLGFEGKLYLTGFFREDIVIIGIGIWELDRSAMAWKEFGFMPDKYLIEFSHGMRFLSMVDCKGVVCFSKMFPKVIIMCDLAVRRWWCPSPCNITGERGLSIGCAIQPHVNLLK